MDLKKVINRIGYWLTGMGNRLILKTEMKKALPYPIKIEKRQTDSNPCGGIEQFDEPNALQLNKARLEHLEALALPLNNKRVLDAGCGTGHLCGYFTNKGCQVVAFDARAENIAELKRRYPDLPAYCLNVEEDPLDHLGDFDIVLCYGLLYHLENPLLALRKLAARCGELLLVETVISDHSLPVVQLIDEYFSQNQALQGIGCRPAPAYVTMALNRIGFPYVWAPKLLPDHDEFRFAWKNKLEHTRDGRLMRVVLIASRKKINNASLVPVFSP